MNDDVKNKILNLFSKIGGLESYEDTCAARLESGDVLGAREVFESVKAWTAEVLGAARSLNEAIIAFDASQPVTYAQAVDKDAEPLTPSTVSDALARLWTPPDDLDSAATRMMTTAARVFGATRVIEEQITSREDGRVVVMFALGVPASARKADAILTALGEGVSDGE